MKKFENLTENMWMKKTVAAVLVSLFAFSGISFAQQATKRAPKVANPSSGNLPEPVEISLQRGNSVAENHNASVRLSGCQGFAGKWDGGSYGIMTLTQNGNSVSGSYEWKGTQSIGGTVRGSVLRGKYYQPNYPEDRYKSGSIKFMLAADGNSWSGTWTDRNGNHAGTWSGTCISN